MRSDGIIGDFLNSTKCRIVGGLWGGDVWTGAPHMKRCLINISMWGKRPECHDVNLVKKPRT